MDALPKTEVMRRWWDAMADLMAVKPGNEPVAVPLQTVFHLA
jgi:L-rhamnose mutarotase